MTKVVVPPADMEFSACPECGRRKPTEFACVCEIADDLADDLNPDELLFAKEYSRDLTTAAHLLLQTLSDLELLPDDEASLWIAECKIYMLLPSFGSSEDSACVLLRMPQRYRGQ